MTEKEFDYMNVIPLVDVMLVLLTIVLTTSTFIATGAIKIELPRSAKNKQQTLKMEMIEVNRSGKCYFNGRLVKLEELQEQIKAKNRDIPILIRADRNIPLQNFVDVLTTVKSMGFKSVSLQTQDRP